MDVQRQVLIPESLPRQASLPLVCIHRTDVLLKAPTEENEAIMSPCSVSI